MRTTATGWKRHRRSAIGALVALAFVGAACGDDNSSSTTTAGATTTAAGATTTAGGATTTAAGTTTPVTEATTTTAAPGTPKKGGTITIGYEAETDRFDPGNGNISIPARAVHHLVYGSLTAATPDGRWVPYLAEKVTPNADATEWTVTLRPNMKFHDGAPFDAEHVKASMDRIRLESLSKDAFAYITDVVVVDPLNVKITLNKKFAVFDQVLADEFGAIVSIDATKKYGDAYGDHPTGAGPYMVKEYVRDDHLTLVKNPDFFMDNRGWADTIIFKPIPDDAARASALLAGDLDIISTSNNASIAELQGNDKVDVHVEPNGAQGILFSIKNIPDIRVRQAVAMAIDKQALIDTVFNGVGEAVDTPFASDNYWFDANAKYPAFDTAGAKALIDTVATETGKPVHLRIVSNVDETSTNYKLAIAEQLRAVGIDIEVVNATDGDAFVNTYIQGDYDLITAGVFALKDPWFEYTRRYRSDSVLNGTGFKEQALDDGLTAGEQSTDPAKRKAGYDVVQEALADNLVQMFTVTRSTAIVTSKNIGGYGSLVGPDGQPSIGNFPLFLYGDEFYRLDI